MKFRIFPFFFLLFSCSFTSNTKQEVVDGPKPKDYYEKNHSCDQTEQELEKYTWVIDKPYEKVASIRPNDNKRKPSSNEELLDMLGQGCDDLNRSEINEQSRITSFYGQNLVSPMSYRNSVSSFQDYIDDVGGINHFSAEEMTEPNNAGAAKKCGLTKLLPLKCRWGGAIAQGLMAEKFRDVINQDSSQTKIIRLRNWYRPNCYNSKVGGAALSDHRWSRGFDLDFPSAKDRAKAQRYLCQLYKERPFSLQVGIGCRTLHVGVGSPRGTRFWTYGSLQKCEVKRISGDDCWRITSSGNKYIHTDQQSTGAL